MISLGDALDCKYVADAPASLATGCFADALERGRATRRAWSQDGTLLSAADYATRRGIVLQLAHAWRHVA